MNWMRYLIIGINILIGLFATSCDKGEEVDYTVNLDYYYINNTNVSMEIKTFNVNQDGYNILNHYRINSQDTLYININTDGPRNLELSEIKQPVLFSDSTVIIYDQLKCEKFVPADIGVNNIANYRSTEIKNNYFELEYKFTNEDFMNAEDCN